MKALDNDCYHDAVRYGRPANATVNGQRLSGYLLGNRFVFFNGEDRAVLECLPGEFAQLKVWRK